MLKGKTAIITGGTRGIGFATVKKFLENGANVALLGSREETVEKALEILKKEFCLFCLPLYYLIIPHVSSDFIRI